MEQKNGNRSVLEYPEGVQYDQNSEFVKENQDINESNVT